MVKNLPSKAGGKGDASWEDHMEEEMGTHSRILAWKIPWTEEPCGIRLLGSQRVDHKGVHSNS